MPAPMPHRRSLTVAALVFLAATPLHPQGWPGRDRLEAEACRPLQGDGVAWLDRAARATGLATLASPLRFTASEGDAQFFQSDRMYPPYIGSSTALEYTFDPASGAERGRVLVPGGGKGRDLVLTTRALLVVRDSALAPAASGYRYFAASRALNPLAVLADWRGTPVVVEARCRFRDYPRVVLTHGVPGERLYLDEKTGVPVKFERMEPHVLWGQVRAEYVYTTWTERASAILPVAAVRYIDGVEHLRRDLALPQGPNQVVARLVTTAEAWPAALPAPLPDHTGAPDLSRREMPVDTVRVDARTLLLRTPMYTHAVTQVGDTVYLFDATTAEWRSRADSAWIARLFPSHKAVALVVTDLAWPHISGVRYWAARGATIVTHRLSQPMLGQVLERHWTLEPDLLETTRARAGRPRWLLVDTTASLAGGAIRLGAIDGVASEGALYAMMPGAGFLWAGDYIQTVDAPSLYAREVMAAVRRAGFTPERVAAQHLPLATWTQVTSANPPS